MWRLVIERGAASFYCHHVKKPSVGAVGDTCQPHDSVEHNDILPEQNPSNIFNAA
jgi:hypothetical protein